MSKEKRSVIASAIILAIGVVMMYFGTTISICSGWNLINPLCWIGSIFTHSVLFFGGLALAIAGIIRLIFR